MSDNALVKLDAAQHALAECKTVMEAKSIADVAEAARVYLERTNASAETVNRATEIRLLAERQMGEFLKKMPKAQGGWDSRSNTRTQQDAPTLAEIGIARHESSRAQKLADIPAPEFRDRIETAKMEGKLSTAAVLGKPRRVNNLFNYPAWKNQTRALVISWLSSMPKEYRADAAKYLSELPAHVLTIIPNEKR